MLYLFIVLKCHNYNFHVSTCIWDSHSNVQVNQYNSSLEQTRICRVWPTVDIPAFFIFTCARYVVFLRCHILCLFQTRLWSYNAIFHGRLCSMILGWDMVVLSNGNVDYHSFKFPIIIYLQALHLWTSRGVSWQIGSFLWAPRVPLTITMTVNI